MKDKQSITQFLKVKTSPFVIKDDKGNQIYYESSNGYWSKREYDDKNNEIYFENSIGYWMMREYDDKNNEIYFEESSGYWSKCEYVDKDRVYYENSSGKIIDNRSKPVIELTLEDIAKMRGVDVSQLRIKE
jgi:hypothetical protein